MQNQHKEVRLFIQGICAPWIALGRDGTVEVTEKFLHKLKCKYNKIKIETMDERLTTVAAHKTMNFLDINKHKKRGIVDTISAVYILETYMNKTK